MSINGHFTQAYLGMKLLEDHKPFAISDRYWPQYLPPPVYKKIVSQEWEAKTHLWLQNIKKCIFGAGTITTCLPLRIALVLLNNLIILERASRCFLKVALFKPRLFPTFQLYLEANVLGVRQLYLLWTLIRQYSNSYSIFGLMRKRNLQQKIFNFRLHKKLNIKKLNILLLTKHEAK